MVQLLTPPSGKDLCQDQILLDPNMVPKDWQTG